MCNRKTHFYGYFLRPHMQTGCGIKPYFGEGRTRKKKRSTITGEKAIKQNKILFPGRRTNDTCRDCVEGNPEM